MSSEKYIREDDKYIYYYDLNGVLVLAKEELKPYIKYSGIAP